MIKDKKKIIFFSDPASYNVSELPDFHTIFLKKISNLSLISGFFFKFFVCIFLLDFTT